MEEKLKLQAFGMHLIEGLLLSRERRNLLEVAATVYGKAITSGEKDEYMRVLADVVMRDIIEFEAAWNAIEANEED